MAECKGCGKQITWAESPNGKKLPLEKVYAWEIDDREGIEDLPLGQGAMKILALKIERDIYISHFLTCPKSNQFSGGGR